MCAFQIRDKAPGVYIDEIDVAGPIAGVATSIAAFVGPALRGPIGVPQVVTSWTEFNTIFGNPDPAVGPYIAQPRSYAAHAVEGYFANGGAACYFVRVGTAVRASRRFQDANNNDTLLITATRDGSDGNQISAQITQSPSIATTKIVSETAPITGGADDEVTLATSTDASKFRVGDRVEVSDGNPQAVEEGQITDIVGSTLTLDRFLSRQFGQGNVRHADLTAGQTRLRVEKSAGIDPGSNLEFTQQGGPAAVVRTVNGVEGGTGFLVLAAPLGNAYDLTVGDVDVKSREFALILNGGAERFEPLSRDPRHSRYFPLGVDSQLVDVSAIATPSQPPGDTPAAATSRCRTEPTTTSSPWAAPSSSRHRRVGGRRRGHDRCVPDRTDQGRAADDDRALRVDAGSLRRARPAAQRDADAGHGARPRQRRPTGWAWTRSAASAPSTTRGSRSATRRAPTAHG